MLCLFSHPSNALPSFVLPYELVNLSLYHIEREGREVVRERGGDVITHELLLCLTATISISIRCCFPSCSPFPPSRPCSWMICWELRLGICFSNFLFALLKSSWWFFTCSPSIWDGKQSFAIQNCWVSFDLFNPLTYPELVLVIFY